MRQFFSLLFFYLLARVPLLIFGIIPFSFDHGKDSLATMHMLLLGAPKLIGPWTSIPGLYLGPGYYYLLAPGFLTAMFDPMSGMITLLLLGVLQLWLAWKYFGLMAALMIVSAPIWYTVTTSAWSVFPITSVAWLILVILKKLSGKMKIPKNGWQKTKQISPEKLWGILGALMASGFHFSNGAAFLYPLLVFVSIRIHKIAISWRKIFFALGGFALISLPQFIFELRHGFSQTKGVLAYIRGEVNIETSIKPSLFKVFAESSVIMKQAFLPKITQSSLEHILGFVIFGVALFLSWKWRNQAGKEMLKKRFFEFTAWFVITILWLTLTHFNFWYLLSLVPLVVVWFSEFLKHIDRRWSISLAGLLIFTSGLFFYQGITTQEDFSKRKEFLPIKKQAIDLIYEKAEGKPFASYHYVPDIYDFSYQYLYFWRATQGRQLPVDFAYEPNVTQYIVQKPDLLEYFSKSISNKPAEKIFFIVEKPQVDYLLDNWWNRQKYGEIINEYKLSESLTVFEARP